MIEWVEAHARERWRDWTGRRARRLRVATLISYRHGYPGTTLLIGDGLRPPAVAVKVALSPETRPRTVREYECLSLAQRELPLEYREAIPAPLDIFDSDGGVALFMRALPGKHPVFPILSAPADRLGLAQVDRYLVSVLDWTTGLSRSTRSLGMSEDPVVSYLNRFPRQGRAEQLLGSTPGARSWQHCDPALGNVLLGRKVGLIDWEHASADSLPWHDVAYVVLWMALLAAHQGNSRPVDAFDALYHPKSAFGDLVRRRVTESWSHSIPINVGLTITAMHLATWRTDGAWDILARHLLSGAGPEWLHL